MKNGVLKCEQGGGRERKEGKEERVLEVGAIWEGRKSRVASSCVHFLC